MHVAANLSQLNWFAVAAVVAFSFVLGALWHSKLLFGEAWKAEVQLRIPDKNKMNMPLIFGSAFVCNALAVLALAILVGRGGPVLNGIEKGLFLSIFMTGTGLGVTYVFAQRSLRLFMIDAGFFVVLYGIAGAVFSVW
jgi:hypothetical protein